MVMGCTPDQGWPEVPTSTPILGVLCVIDLVHEDISLERNERVATGEEQ